MTGCVFGLQRFCVDDGPGIRTCVYLKGCNMRCAWCHNPESWRPEPETAFFEDRCTLCGRCARVCPAHDLSGGRHAFDRARCACGGLDAASCKNHALTRIGEWRTAESLLGIVRRDLRYYQKSGGGLTVTGGEPLMQKAFLTELLRGAKAIGLDVCVESNASFDPDDYLEILPYTDTFLLDYKLTDDGEHRRLTGVSNERVLFNIKNLCEIGARVVLRCPIIPGVNDNETHFEAIARLTREWKLLGCELMPYHALGRAKAERVGFSECAYPVPDEKTVADWHEIIRSYGGREWRRGI